MPTSRVYVVDDDEDLAQSLAGLLLRAGYAALSFTDPAVLKTVCSKTPPHCILTDVMMGPYNGFNVADDIRSVDSTIAFIFMTAWPRTAAAVDAVRRYGGIDYLEKPVDEERLIDGVQQAVAWSRERRIALKRLERMTPREWDVFRLLCRGLSNKMIAATLDIKPKTVEDHRSSIMLKTKTGSIAALIELERALEQRG